MPTHNRPDRPASSSQGLPQLRVQDLLACRAVVEPMDLNLGVLLVDSEEAAVDSVTAVDSVEETEADVRNITSCYILI